MLLTQVTGDNLDTAVAIAKRCGILREMDFEDDPSSYTGKKTKPNRAMEGKVFRKRVYYQNPEDPDGDLVFNQVAAWAAFLTSSCLGCLPHE